MKKVSFENRRGCDLTLIIEPIAEEYHFPAGSSIMLSGDLLFEGSELIETIIEDDALIVYCPEEVTVERDGNLIRAINRGVSGQA